MQYMLLIYEIVAHLGKMSEQESGAMFAEYMKFTDDIRKSGRFLAGAPLQPTPTATTVRVRDGKRLTTDGPFAETKEQLGGYYLVDAQALDAAMALAARIPSARLGSIEVRPVMAMNG